MLDFESGGSAFRPAGSARGIKSAREAYTRRTVQPGNRAGKEGRELSQPAQRFFELGLLFRCAFSLASSDIEDRAIQASAAVSSKSSQRLAIMMKAD